MPRKSRARALGESFREAIIHGSDRQVAAAFAPLEPLSAKERKEAESGLGPELRGCPTPLECVMTDLAGAHARRR